jgi:hypothetical protein
MVKFGTHAELPVRENSILAAGRLLLGDSVVVHLLVPLWVLLPFLLGQSVQRWRLPPLLSFPCLLSLKVMKAVREAWLISRTTRWYI